MVKERNELRREHALLAEQISQTQNGMRAAARAAALASQGDDRALERGFTYQDAEAFTATLKRSRAIDVRLTELTQRLDACC